MTDSLHDRRSGEQGLIFNIQRYSIHDGPGIRTTVFFKGCPLRCRWCSNPESINTIPEIVFRSARCDGCGKCVSACEPGALKLDGNQVEIDRQKCDLCLKCVSACFAEALEITGRYYSLEEVLDEASRDEPFYHNSGGGVTLSGGEPLYQPEFAINLLKACKAKGLHTTLDTSGQVKWEVFEKALPYIDLVMYDIKHIDEESHKSGAGISNTLILENLRRIADTGNVRLWIRIPVIPGFNDSNDHFERLAAKIKGLPAEKVSLLTYHEWGKTKYEALGREYLMQGAQAPSAERMEELAVIVRAAGFEVTADY